MRLAAVDIGTNTTSMVIIGREPRELRYSVLEDYGAVTGLGRDRGADGTLDRTAIARTTAVLRLFRRRMVMMDVGRVLAAATAAVREAPDRGFADRASALLDTHLVVLGGSEEADTTFAAVAAEFGDGDALAMIDVGGGSTEIAIGRRGRIQRRVSAALGAVSCTEGILGRRVPPRPEDLDRISDEVLRVFASFDDGQQPHVVGVAGTATTLLAVRDAVDPYDAARVHGATITADDLAELEARMSRMDTEAIAALAGMQAGRAPFAVAGCRLLRTAMVCLGQSSLTVSDRGLRFGLLYREYPRIRIS